MKKETLKKRKGTLKKIGKKLFMKKWEENNQKTSKETFYNKK